MDDDQRRRFYRIDDRLAVSVRREQGEANELGGIERFRKYDETLVALEQQINTVIASASVPELAEFMRLLNCKYDYLFDAVGLGDELAKRTVYRETDINISGSGAAFTVPEKYQVDETLQLAVKFPEGEKTLAANVVRCDAVDGDMPYMLYLDFPTITLEDQEFIIRHVALRQGEMLARRRLEREAQASG